jgi:hypothetical protein
MDVASIARRLAKLEELHACWKLFRNVKVEPRKPSDAIPSDTRTDK